MILNNYFPNKKSFYKINDNDIKGKLKAMKTMFSLHKCSNIEGEELKGYNEAIIKILKKGFKYYYYYYYGDDFNTFVSSLSFIKLLGK